MNSIHRDFGIERVYLPLCKVADTPFQFQVAYMAMPQTNYHDYILHASLEKYNVTMNQYCVGVKSAL